MDSLILLAVIAVVPILLGLLFRVNAVFLFLSAAAGYILVQYIADDASLALDMIVRTPHNTLYAQLGVLIAPTLVTLFLLRRTMPKTAGLLHIPLVVASGLALAAMALPLLDSQAQEKIFANQYGAMLRDSQDIVIGAAAGLALIVMWLTSRHKEEKKKKHH